MPVRVLYCRFMPDAWTPDDLRFALIRAAHLEPPWQVASDLLVAADQPATRLSKVSAFQARLRAAEVLLEAGERSEGITVLRRALQEAGRDPDPRTLLAAAGVFAEAGDAAEAETLVMKAFGVRPDGQGLLGDLVKVSLALATLGYFDQALCIADETIARTSRRPDRRGRAGLKVRITRIAELARQQIVAFQQACSQPPWPALAASCLLWWPGSEYSRVVGQVPQLRDVLGAPWRGHAARVEKTMVAAAGEASPASSSAAQLSLAAADYEKFVQYLERTGADPRRASVMTAFTQQAGAGYEHAAPWPPGRRDLCWCGSKKRYHRCCAA
jgi:tetratricopeptide (TPR) repeat protein